MLEFAVDAEGPVARSAIQEEVHIRDWKEFASTGTSMARVKSFTGEKTPQFFQWEV